MHLQLASLALGAEAVAPARQAVQVVAPAAAYWPAGQGVQAPVVLCAQSTKHPQGMVRRGCYEHGHLGYRGCWAAGALWGRMPGQPDVTLRACLCCYSASRSAAGTGERASPAEASMARQAGARAAVC